jgi:hypothetical protein
MPKTACTKSACKQDDSGVKMADVKKQTRYIMAIFFILCGLIISIGGSYGYAIRHYVGDVPITDVSRVLMLREKYTGYVGMGSETTLHYDIPEIKKGEDIRNLEGLSYTSQSHLIPLLMLVGLAYSALGLCFIFKKDFLIKKSL